MPKVKRVPWFVLDRLPHPGRGPQAILLNSEPTEENREAVRRNDIRKAQQERAWQNITDAGKTLKPGMLYRFAALWIEVWQIDSPQGFIERFSVKKGAFKVGYWRERKAHPCHLKKGECKATTGNCVHVEGNRVWNDVVLPDAARRF